MRAYILHIGGIGVKSSILYQLSYKGPQIKKYWAGTHILQMLSQVWWNATFHSIHYSNTKQYTLIQKKETSERAMSESIYTTCTKVWTPHRTSHSKTMGINMELVPPLLL